MDAVWREYLQWTQAIAEVVYPETGDGAPVYLDLEEDVLAAIASRAGHDGPARQGLRDVVIGVVVADDSFSLAALLRREAAWRTRRDLDEAPPCLGFLAVTVLAAEDMGAADDGLSQNAYYARLCSLLELAGDSHHVRAQYMGCAEQLWGDLNRWLERLEGRRGTPTAYSLSYRYVGLPVSQALVREGDRRRFPIFFAQYGLPAGSELAPEVLERYLDAWFTSETCPLSASLKKLWGKGSARERIAAVAAVELTGWDGTIEAGETPLASSVQRASLMAQLRRGFMGQSLDLALTLRTAPDEDLASGVEVESAEGQWMPVGFVPAVANVWRTSYSGDIDVSSVLEGVVKLRTASAVDHLIRHHPRSVVPLVLDELQAAYVEAERLQLNVDSMVLVRTVAQGRPLAANVLKSLATCARPGFKVHNHLSGLPDGWTLISDVQLFGSPGPGTPYNELVPLARDQLTIAGGMRIPSRIRKWSVVAPPELRASVSSTADLSIVLSDGDDRKQELHRWTSEGGALVVALGDAGLGVGDYNVALFAGGAKSPLQQATVRLRSANEVDAGWELSPRLVYALTAPGGPAEALAARELGAELPDVLVDGVVAEGLNPAQPAVTLRASRSLVWKPKGASAPAPVVRVGNPDPGSCVVTGAHYLEYPTFMGGWQPKYIEGVCKYCGLVRRSPGWIPRNQFQRSPGQGDAHVEVASLPAVQDAPARLWDAALDAVMHLGGGSAAALTSVASQIDGSALFTSSFPTRLEALGHIAVERAPDGAPERWEISPSCLVPRGSDSLELVGFWPESSIDHLLDVADLDADRFLRIPAEGQPTRRVLKGVDPAAVAAAAESAELACVAWDAPGQMLRALPPLSAVALALPRRPMPGFSQAERFDVDSASWVQTSDVSLPGAYRLARGFERLHVYRSPDDLAVGEAVQGSVYLVKHLAASALGRTLVVHVPKLEYLAVPLGCDLPGLYARATVVASGVLPKAVELAGGGVKRRCLVYSSITSQHADLLATLLSR